MQKKHGNFSGSFPKPLTREEERAYTDMYQNGNEAERKEAFDVLVTRNLRLVAHISKKYSHREQEDVISIGTLGLIKAVATFNPANGAKLSTYASRCIDNEILMDWRTGKRKPKEGFLADAVMRDKEGNPVTYLEKLADEDADVAGEVIANSEKSRLMKALEDTLEGREKQVLIKRYGLDGGEELTQRELAAQLGISRSYVSRIEKRALLMLYDEMTKHDAAPNS